MKTLSVTEGPGTLPFRSHNYSISTQGIKGSTFRQQTIVISRFGCLETGVAGASCNIRWPFGSETSKLVSMPFNLIRACLCVCVWTVSLLRKAWFGSKKY